VAAIFVGPPIQWLHVCWRVLALWLGPMSVRGNPFGLIPLLPHLLLCLLVSFTFSFFSSSIILLFHPFPFDQNTPTLFPGQMSLEATEPGFSFFVLILLCVFLVICRT